MSGEYNAPEITSIAGKRIMTYETAEEREPMPRYVRQFSDTINRRYAVA